MYNVDVTLIWDRVCDSDKSGSRVLKLVLEYIYASAFILHVNMLVGWIHAHESDAVVFCFIGLRPMQLYCHWGDRYRLTANLNEKIFDPITKKAHAEEIKSI